MVRGQLILIEGLDRTGKTTQTTLLLKKLQPNAELIKFPQRDTPIGKIINQYLTDPDYSLPDQAVHLLFSANRWEVMDTIKKSLANGKNIILDRYVYSGIAYSAAKETAGMDLEWCLAPDKGLLRPDLTLFLVNNDDKDGVSRAGYGDERYEIKSFQDKVRQQFELTFQNLSSGVDGCEVQELDVTAKSIEEVAELVWTNVEPLLQNPNEEFAYF